MPAHFYASFAMKKLLSRILYDLMFVTTVNSWCIWYWILLWQPDLHLCIYIVRLMLIIQILLYCVLYISLINLTINSYTSCSGFSFLHLPCINSFSLLISLQFNRSNWLYSNDINQLIKTAINQCYVNGLYIHCLVLKSKEGGKLKRL